MSSQNVVRLSVCVKADAPPLVFRIGDPEDRLSVAHALTQGYKITLDADGSAEVTNPAGVTYHMHDFECDCPDKLGRGGSYQGHCKHELWIGQIRPCEICGGTMVLGEFRTCLGEVLRRFECPDCGNARDFGLVRTERRANRYSTETPGFLAYGD